MTTEEPPHDCVAIERELAALEARNAGLVDELRHIKDSPAWTQLSRALQDRITRAIGPRR